MFTGLDDIDWASMEHAYGSAEEVPALLRSMGSADVEERNKAFDEFYGVVYHQNSVYEPTAASLPFLFELACDAGTPDRAAVVELIVGIGEDALAFLDRPYEPYPAWLDAVAELRRRADTLVAFTADPDVCVRRAAIPALALFVDDGGARAVALLRDRLPAEHGLVERLAVVEAMATLALRLPAVSEQARTWLAAVVTAPDADAQTRLAALAQHTRCTPDSAGREIVAAAVELLEEIAIHAPSERTWRHPAPETATTQDVPPQVVAAFDHLERSTRVYAYTTRTLRTLHEALAESVAPRTELLAAQLRSPDPGSRLDAIRMSGDLMKDWRGDHTPLVLLVAEQLGARDREVAAEAAAVLDACHAIAGQARETLGAHVAAQRAEHGPNVWADPDPELRRAHQTAVCVLARFGDARALPSLLVALDGGVDAWRAFQVAGRLPQSAHVLVSRLCGHLRDADLARSWFEGTAPALLDALSRLGDASAVPAISDTLAAAARDEHRDSTVAALKALASFGPAAADALPLARRLTSAPETRVRIAAIETLHALGGDRDEVRAAIVELAESEGGYWIREVGDLLGRIGPPVAPVLVTHLREALTHNYEWQRVHAATALWDLFGEPETQTVLDTLLRAWEENSSTANHIVACLDRMGAAAEPAVPTLRAALALAHRDGWAKAIESDEELQRITRRVLAKFD
ncbi:HEAT repeat domain-containing protein [Embleya sp. NBC_00896]|uniref:HEAT repeat domain-containing protein n=1 Tax=Embleya sp. NBC_00896 TaxID=2975961 RepID=UPI002F90CEC9|nr:HEAT repeat domain-containing protein [Embleya sp. NBC_00896]